jgi:hypothetical protein
MDWLLQLVPGGILTVIAGAAMTFLTFIGALLYNAKKAGRDSQIAKEAKAREANLDRIKRAAAARPRGGVLDDLRNRDER